MPSIALEAVKRIDTAIGVLSIIIWVFIGGTLARAWWQQLPWRVPAVAFIAFLVYGFLRAVYQEHSVVERDRNQLRDEKETKEKRDAIGQRLADLYYEGAELRAEIMDSTDESPVSVWKEGLRAWRQRVADYLAENVSTGKAQYVDAVTSVPAVSRTGMKSSTTRRGKETIVSHLDERLKRLAEVAKEY